MVKLSYCFHFVFSSRHHVLGLGARIMIRGNITSDTLGVFIFIRIKKDDYQEGKTCLTVGWLFFPDLLVHRVGLLCLNCVTCLMFLRLIDWLFEEIEVFHTLGGTGEGHVRGSEEGTHTTSLTLFTCESEERRGVQVSLCVHKNQILCRLSYVYYES